MLSVHHPGSSLLHRLPPGPKVLGLVLISAVVVWVDSPGLQCLALIAALMLFARTDLPWRLLAEQIRFLWPVVLLFAVVQLWIAGPLAALSVVLRLLLLYLLAMMLSWTTRSRELLQWLVKALGPLQRFGVPVHKLSLLASLTLRFIPMVFSDFQALADARKARGARVRTLPLLLPLLIHSLKKADQLAEAIDARAYR